MGRFAGFGITLRQVFTKPVTTRYPKEKREKPERFHGRHVLNPPVPRLPLILADPPTSLTPGRPVGPAVTSNPGRPGSLANPWSAHRPP